MLTINIEDTLDLAPTFTQSVYSVAVNEGMYTNVSAHIADHGFDVMHIAPETIRPSKHRINIFFNVQEVVGRVIAQETTRPNAIIRYERVSGSTLFSVVSSGANAGQIILTGTVDAENTDTYAITIRVSGMLSLTGVNVIALCATRS